MNLAMTILQTEYVEVKDLTVETKRNTEYWIYNENNIRVPFFERPSSTVTFLVSRQYLALIKKQAENKKLKVVVNGVKIHNILNSTATCYLNMDIHRLHIDEYREDNSILITVEGSEMNASIGEERDHEPS